MREAGITEEQIEKLEAVLTRLEELDPADVPEPAAELAALLGSILEAKGDRTGAIGHYRHATKLVPDDAGPHMALARGLAGADGAPVAGRRSRASHC